MTLVALEALNFGLGRLVTAAQARGHSLVLLTRDRGFYRHELSQPSCAQLRVIDVETFDVDDVIEAVKSIPDVVGLINPTDAWSLVGLQVAEQLDVPHQAPDSLRLVRDKASLRGRLHARGLSRSASVRIDPNSASAVDLRAGPDFPVIVKDVAGTSSRNVWLARGPDDLEAILAAARGTVLLGGGLTVESYFSGPLFSIEAVSWEGQTRVLGISSRMLSREPHFREEALSFPVAFPEAQRQSLVRWLTVVLEALSYRSGFSHTELILTSYGAEVVEVNPRLGGALVGEAACEVLGVNVYEAFIDLALGRRPTLMDLALHARQGAAQVLVYPDRAGTLEGVEGTEEIADHPGRPRFFPVAAAGERIDNVTDQRGCVGVLLTTGATAELALHNALSAAGKLHVRLRETSETR